MTAYSFYRQLEILAFLLGFCLKSPGTEQVLGKAFDWPDLGQVPNLWPGGRITWEYDSSFWNQMVVEVKGKIPREGEGTGPAKKEGAE